MGYPTGAAILISILLVIFAVWKATGMTFQIRDIVTFRGEALFWSAILVSNTLGTSMGDFLSDSSGLGYAGGALLVTGALAVLVALMKVPVVPNVLLFWIAFVLTRPLGATAGDFLTKPVAKGGLDLGTAGSSAVLLAVLVGLMAYAQVQERRTTPADDGAGAGRPAGRLSPVTRQAGRPGSVLRGCAGVVGHLTADGAGQAPCERQSRGPRRRARRRSPPVGRAGRARRGTPPVRQDRRR